MGFKTVSGAQGGSSGPRGLPVWSPGDTLRADDLNRLALDGGSAFVSTVGSGILSGGEVWADDLTVTVGAGTTYVAGSVVWVSDSDTSVEVDDDAETWVWACSDGVLRTTLNGSPPPGYGESTACPVCRVEAVSGVVSVIDIGVQRRVRSWRAGSTPDPGVFPIVPEVVADGVDVFVPPSHRLTLEGSLEVLGAVTVFGTLEVR